MSPRLQALDIDFQKGGNGGSFSVASVHEANRFIAVNGATVLNSNYRKSPSKLPPARYSPNGNINTDASYIFTHLQKPQKNATKKSACKRYSPQDMKSACKRYSPQEFKSACKRSYSPQELRNITDVFYAGAKFCDHPSPSQLPKPPERWINGRCNSANGDLVLDKHCNELSMQLKMLLKVEG